MSRLSLVVLAAVSLTIGGTVYYIATKNENPQSSVVSGIQAEDWTSRFIVVSDSKNDSVADVPLHPSWWSRPHEYAWVSKFAGPNDVVLDAACGISHPFKWHLANTCKDTWACDSDPRIADYQQILTETNDDLGPKAYEVVKQDRDRADRINLVHTSICKLPDYFPQFDRIFCVSTLEHMNAVDQKSALSAFAKKLAPEGLLVVTVDYPVITPEALLANCKAVGLVPAGKYELGIPSKEAISGYGFNVYRAVFKHEKI